MVTELPQFTIERISKRLMFANEKKIRFVGTSVRINSLHLDLYQNVSGKMFSLTLTQRQMYKQDLKCRKSKNKLISDG